MSLGVVILAAGKGTRMRSDVAKVLHAAAGRTLIDWALHTVAPLDASDVVVVVGHQAESVAQAVGHRAEIAIQEPQHGTGHAAAVGVAALGDVDTVLVLPGDMPLVTSEALTAVVEAHRNAAAMATVVSSIVADPTGYGRIIRAGGDVIGVVEERDATDEQRSIDEINTSVYVFETEILRTSLDRLVPDNDQSEYYLTDVIGIMVADGRRVDAVMVPEEMSLGVNSQRQLADAAAVLRGRINDALLDDGVWMLDPSRVYLDATVEVAPGARLYPDVFLTGATTVGPGASVGPNVEAVDCSIGADAVIRQAVMTSASVGTGALVGPFAYLRPGAVLEPGSKVGTFVEVKKSTIGPGSKVPHLSYIGDTTIGADTNIGAATVTVNYDGFHKHPTVIGDRVRIGSDSMLIAPVTIGDDAYTGAGSVITHDVPDGALGVSRVPQHNVDGYAEKRRRRTERDKG